MLLVFASQQTFPSEYIFGRPVLAKSSQYSIYNIYCVILREVILYSLPVSHKPYYWLMFFYLLQLYIYTCILIISDGTLINEYLLTYLTYIMIATSYPSDYILKLEHYFIIAYITSTWVSWRMCLS